MPGIQIESVTSVMSTNGPIRTTSQGRHLQLLRQAGQKGSRLQSLRGIIPTALEWVRLLLREPRTCFSSRARKWVCHQPLVLQGASISHADVCQTTPAYHSSKSKPAANIIQAQARSKTRRCSTEVKHLVRLAETDYWRFRLLQKNALRPEITDISRVDEKFFECL